MAAVESVAIPDTMASRWRRRSLCILVGERPAPAALRTITGRGAFLETNARPELGTSVQLHHPQIGAIHATVTRCCVEGIELGFPATSHSIGFALAAIAADMTNN